MNEKSSIVWNGKMDEKVGRNESTEKCKWNGLSYL